MNKFLIVRKHRAPKGALRPNQNDFFTPLTTPVRKHRAPNGALRLPHDEAGADGFDGGHKAPSAKRCIKTRTNLSHNQLQPAPS